MKQKVLAWILVMSLLLMLVPAYADEEAGDVQLNAESTSDILDEQGEPEETEALTETEDPEDLGDTEELDELEDLDVPAESEVPELPNVEIVVEEVPFFATVSIEFDHAGDLFYGEKVTLHAAVEANANDYSVAWQFYNEDYDPNDENSVEWIGCGSGENLVITVTAENAGRIYRAVVNGEFVSGKFTLPEATEPTEDEATTETDDEEETEVGSETGDETEDDDDDDDADTEDDDDDDVDADTEDDDDDDDVDADTENDDDDDIDADTTDDDDDIDADTTDDDDDDDDIDADTEDDDDDIVVSDPSEDEDTSDDEEADPIPEEPAPDTSHPVARLEDQLDPNRSIDIYADWGAGPLYFGMDNTFSAVLNGYDNAVYSIQWQVSIDGENWEDVEGAVEASYTMTITEENYCHYWRVVVTVTDVVESEIEE